MEWGFYIYRLNDESGAAMYVGKGSGRRMAVSARRQGLRGHEVARFKREADAYAFERRLIAELSPKLNQHPGGNGSRATKQKRRLADWEKVCAAIGTRAYAARLWLAFAPNCGGDLSKVGAIRQVAYGRRV